VAKATVVNFLPYVISEKKPGLIPEDFLIPLSDGLIPALLVVSDVRCPIYRGGEQPPFNMTIPGEQLANSIVNDYISSQMGYDENSHPAVFWVLGEFTDPKEILTRFKNEIAKAKKKQNNWFHSLVKAADDIWQRYRQHKMITDTQRFAARAMGATNKEWYSSPEPVALITCPACKTLVEGNAIVCKNCKVVLNAEEAKKLGLVFANA